MIALIRRLFILSVLIIITAGVLFFSIAVNHGPQNLAVAWIFVAFVGFTLIPTSGVVEWYLPSGKRRGYGKIRSLLAVAILALAFGYWACAILIDLLSPNGSFSSLLSLAGVGAILSSLGLFMSFYVDATRKHKDLP
jgi:FtsH-binding integral membrane protein